MKDIWRKMDKPLFIMMILYSLIGLAIILSASSVSAVLRYEVSSYNFFIKQAIFVGMAFLVGSILFLNLPTSKYKYFSPFLIVGIIAALIGLFFYGKITNNAISWYRIGSFSLQPSEFAKSILIIYMACFYQKSLKNKNNSIYFNLIPIAVFLYLKKSFLNY